MPTGMSLLSFGSATSRCLLSSVEINVKKKPTFDDGLSIDLHPGAERFFQSVSIR